MYQLGDEKQTSVDLKYNIRGLLYSAHRTQENTLDPSNPWGKMLLAEKRSRGGRQFFAEKMSRAKNQYHYDKVGNIYEITDNRTNPRAYDSGARGDDVWRYVLRGSGKSNAAVDAALGL